MPKTLKYAGIGPRNTPLDVCIGMADVASQLDQQGWRIRSGHAEGADQAWAQGHHPTRREIYLPWSGFNGGRHTSAGHFHVLVATDQIADIAARCHPAWHNLSPAAKKLMMRNVAIILGPHCDDHVEFVAYYGQQRKLAGGTGNAVRIAALFGIPAFNVNYEDEQQLMSEFTHRYIELA